MFKRPRQQDELKRDGAIDEEEDDEDARFGLYNNHPPQRPRTDSPLSLSSSSSSSYYPYSTSSSSSSSYTPPFSISTLVQLQSLPSPLPTLFPLPHHVKQSTTAAVHPSLSSSSSSSSQHIYTPSPLLNQPPPAPWETIEEIEHPSAIKRGAWAKAWLCVTRPYTEKFKKENDRLRLRSRMEAWSDDLYETPRTSGAERRAKIQKAVRNMGLDLEPHQVHFIETVLDACGPHIFGIDWPSELPNVYARTGTKEIRQEILMQTPRRFGKTTVVAITTASLLAFVPGIKIGIFSTSERTSQKLMLEIRTFLFMINGTQERICKHSGEELHLAEFPVGAKFGGGPVNPKTTSMLYCYAASERTTRGFTVDVTILEEAAHMSEALFNYVVVPALGTENMVLLAITTPQDPTNYFSRLTKLKREDGELLFSVQQIGLACGECLKIGQGASCTHMQKALPKWKGRGRQARVKAILGDMNKDIFAQEAQGMIVQKGAALFDSKYVQRLFNSVDHRFAPYPNVIYTFIDPHGAGQQSSQAMLSLTYVGHLKVIFGMDTYDGAVDEDSIRSVENHFDGIRASPQGEKALIVVYIEANMSWVWAERVSVILTSRYRAVKVISLDGRNLHRPGVTTSQNSKESGVLRLQESLEDDSMRFAENMISQNAMKHRELLRDQALNYRRHVKQPKDMSFGKTTSTLSGKAPGVKDDLITALHQLMERSAETRIDPDFLDECQDMGLVP